MLDARHCGGVLRQRRMRGWCGGAREGPWTVANACSLDNSARVVLECCSRRPPVGRESCDVANRPVAAARRRQALWLDGLARARALLAPRERQELLDVARERGVRMRTDVYEALLAAVDPAALLGGT